MGFSDIESYLPLEVERNIVIFAYIISSIITIGLFLLKAVAIKTLAKNKGLDKLYLAWIPFFNYILLGKVIGTCFLFRKRVDNIGILVTIASLTCFVVGTFLDLGYYVRELEYLFNFTIEYDSQFVTNWMAGKGTFYTIIWYLDDILTLIEIVLFASMVFFIFRKYAPERAFMYSILSIFFEFLFGVFLFVIRNKNASRYDEFIRTRVKSGYNSYEESYKKYENKPENDPFPEFNGNNNSKEETKSTLNGEEKDDFFN